MGRLTSRQLDLKNALLEFGWDNYGLDEIDQTQSDHWARDLAIKLDGLVTAWITAINPPPPSPAPRVGRYVDMPVMVRDGRVIFDLDRFYEDVVMPSREMYMDRQSRPSIAVPNPVL